MRRVFSNSDTRQTMILSAAFTVVAALSVPTAQGQQVSKQPISYRTIQVDGLSIFYRDAGPKEAPLFFSSTGFHPHLACTKGCWRACPIAIV